MTKALKWQFKQTKLEEEDIADEDVEYSPELKESDKILQVLHADPNCLEEQYAVMLFDSSVKCWWWWICDERHHRIAQSVDPFFEEERCRASLLKVMNGGLSRITVQRT
jgi:hypothetical protein